MAACGGTVRTWVGVSTSWDTNSNWSAADRPNTATEDVIMKSTGFNASFLTSSSLGCVDVLSGTINGTTNNRTMTIVGDYFSAPFQNSLNITSNSFSIAMAGATAQTFEAVDDLRDLTINNRTSVTLKNSFRILSSLTLTGTGTTVVEGIVQLSNALTIPAGHTIVIKDGGAIYSNSNLTVNGSLKIEGGGELRMANGRTLSVPVGGTLEILGSSGNAASITSLNASSWFTFTVAGSVKANYAIIKRVTSNGMNVTGTIIQLDNTDFRGMVSSGYMLTLGAAAAVPANFNTIGFYNDDAVATPRNINASAYNVSNVNVNLTSGSVAGAAFENDAAFNRIFWPSSATTQLNVVDDAESNEPTTTLAVNTSVTFAEFAFSLSQGDTATDITEVILTMTGTATMSDLASVQVYRDVDGDCNYTGGTDTQIGSNLNFTGSPLRATVTIAAGQLTTNSSTQQACLLVRATSGLAPVDQHTLGFKILSSTDITNSQNYPVGATSGPPVQSRSTILINNTVSTWEGSSSTSWSNTNNWTPATLPSATRDCKIGLGIRTTLVNVNPIRCGNATLQTSGTLDFNNSGFPFEITNSIDVSTGFNFSNAATSSISMRGAVNQTTSVKTAFPGNLIINNTGAASSNIVSVGANSTINGNLTCTDGILSIPNGVTLTILGAITIQSGCTISIEAGGTLALADARTLTVDSGGILQMVGNSGLKAIMTSNSGAAAYNVIINGTIKARYYTFDHLNTTGVSVESGATIDTNDYLQDGTYSYPVNSNTTFLKLKKQIPGNALSNMIFAKNSSAAAGTLVNIDTTGAAAGTLAITDFSGDLSGETYDKNPEPLYDVTWTGALNTIAITQEATSPTPVSTGTTYNMGRYGFQQVLAGGTFVDTNVTTLAFSLTGTGSASDVSVVKLYSDSSCSGSGGTLIGTETFSGSPSKVTFTIAPGALVIPAAPVTTVKVCAYVEYQIATNGLNGNTVGVELSSASDFVNSETYPISAGSTIPLTLGAPAVIFAPTTTTWTGSTSTAWETASNWTNGKPLSTVTCIIPNAANDPIISTATVATCKNINITDGILTINATRNLDIYGDFNKTGGTLTNNGVLSIKDSGANINHNLVSNTTMTNLTLAKTGTGTVFVDQSSLTINTLNFSSATTTFEIPNTYKLILPNGVTLSLGTLKIAGGGTLEIGNAQTITVSGGTFRIAGSNDTFPQNIATKGVVQVTGGGANSYNFTATSGTVNLSGFQFDRLGINGLNIGGTTSIVNLGGGQFTNLSTTYANVKAIQINNSGSLPTVATNIAWTWGNFNSFNPANAGTPATTDAYKLIHTTGCGSRTIDFTGWTGDWYEARATFDVTTKRTSLGTCTINMGASASAVSLLTFVAVPFNSAIDIRWRTNAEQNHLGFNVYKADLYSSRFQQINKTLIRNLKDSGSNQVSYRFIDNDVSNGQKYYYYLEDVEVGGKRVLHGPVFATALSTLGSPPVDNINENSDSNTDDADDGGTTSPSPIPNPSYEDLGNGIIILSKTSKSMRIEITPATPSFSASAWNNLYEDVLVSGYSKMTLIGSPELPEKDILIEVQSFAQTAHLINATVIENTLAGHLISPAPNYTLNGSGVLVPNYSPDATRYGSTSLYPAAYYSIETDLISGNKAKFLKLKINPLKLSASVQSITMATKIILDIGLDGDDWDVTLPDINSNLGPYSISNTLRIDFEQSGVYQIDYADFVNSEVEGPFKNTTTGLWKLYYKDVEIPLEIYSVSGNFSSGDFIRFYVPFNKELESRKNQLILSPVNLSPVNSAPKRIESLDANPDGKSESSEVLTKFTKTIEQNLKYIDGITLNDSLDHFFYASLVNFVGMDTLSVITELPEIDVNSSENVIVKYHVRGRPGMSGIQVRHHVNLTLAGVVEGEAEFEENDRQVLLFEIPADRFIAGNNTLSFKVLGTYAPATDNDFVLVDKIEIIYNGFAYGSSGISTFSLADSLRVHTLGNFSTNQLFGYDITIPLEPKKLSNLLITSPDGGFTYDSRFFVDDEVDSDNLKHFSFLPTNAFLKPTGLSLNPGVENSLKNTSNRADLIVFGDETLIVALKDLIDRRIAQGLEVMTVTPDQVYGEFSHGVQKSKALKDFINTALNNWEKAPKFLLILGDSTFDPQDYNVSALAASERSVLERGTLPAPLIPGRFIDFSSDNYFVSSETSQMPRLSVGRLPTNDPDKIKIYVDKIQAYEDGEAAPRYNFKKITFFADQDTGNYESFNQLSQSMMAVSNGFINTLYDRSELGSKALTKTKIRNEFSFGPLMISLMGHGAFDRFGDDIFNVSDARLLSNSIFPIVANWNCESAYFYDADKTYKSLGEELIFNPNGGAIVYMGSTTQTTPPAQAKLAQNFFSQLSSVANNPWTGTRLGDLLLQAKMGVGMGSYERDIVNSFSIIGDPSLKLPPQLYPEAISTIVPKVKKTGIFGCSAFAGDSVSDSPWHEGFLEWAIYMWMIVYGSKKLFRKSSI